jgi:hypothetical protein
MQKRHLDGCGGQMRDVEEEHMMAMVGRTAEGHWWEVGGNLVIGNEDQDLAFLHWSTLQGPRLLSSGRLIPTVPALSFFFHAIDLFFLCIPRLFSCSNISIYALSYLIYLAKIRTHLVYHCSKRQILHPSVRFLCVRAYTDHDNFFSFSMFLDVLQIAFSGFVFVLIGGWNNSCSVCVGHPGFTAVQATPASALLSLPASIFATTSAAWYGQTPMAGRSILE